MNKLIFSKINNRLRWGVHSYDAVSGGFGNGPIPNGIYEVEIRKVVLDPTGSGFKDKITGKSWFIPVTPSFSTSRNGLGIHPDGSPKGTKGCIGLQGQDADKFWKKWNRTQMKQRPISLTVK